MSSGGSACLYGNDRKGDVPMTETTDAGLERCSEAA
jgi:hypothetical protein